MPNRMLLLNTLAGLSSLDGRYANIECVNYDPANSADKRGCFSLVFKATDLVTGKNVALKFFDPDPRLLLDSYRIEAFKREPVILQTLLGKRRCLQLIEDCKLFNLSAPTPPGTSPYVIPCMYFALEWYDDQIDEYFERQHQFDAETKLLLFNDTLLAVEVLHKHAIFHRDLKPDNIRSYVEALKRIVVAIDLGTAARLTSPFLIADYNRSVGAPAYAAPEALCGLAGVREIAQYTDHYALGCMFFELFNSTLFVDALIGGTYFWFIRRICG